MQYHFKNKVAMVTGAGSGIGQAVSILLAKHGCKLCLIDLNEVALDETLRLSGSQTDILIQVGDVSNVEFIQSCIQQIDQQFSRLDFAFNNAGISSPIKSITDLSMEIWHNQINVNLNSIFYCLHFQIPLMLKNGGGSIVNTSSILGTVATENRAAYITAKHGVTGLSKAAALDYAQQNIRVNSIHPGYIETPLIRNIQTEKTRRKHPIQRLGTVDEVANLVIFLLSDQASFITGANYAIDGGYTTQ